VIGIVVLSISVMLYTYRRIVQDKQPWIWREPATAVEADLVNR